MTRRDRNRVAASRCLILAIPFFAAVSAKAQLSPQMREAFPGAAPVPVYSPDQRRAAAQEMWHMQIAPVLEAPVSLTPNAPYAPNGAHLSFWKPAFVLGTRDGGEAGVNFWGLHNEGHINVGFTALPGQPVLLDCRLLSAGNVTYKVYAGAGSAARTQGETPLRDNHFLLAVQAPVTDEPVSVELWPTPETATMGFLGCEIDTIGGRR